MTREQAERKIEAKKQFISILSEEMQEAIEKYIKYYNEKRIKEKLGWVSPVQYRLNALAA